MSELEVVKSSQCLTGWRTWHFLEPHYLSDIGYRMIWEPRKEAEAKCKTHSVVPDLHCGCGLYSFTTKEEMFQQNYSNRDSLVWGTINMWGRVIEHRRGYKASHAYFKELWLHPSLAHLTDWFQYVYGVPTHTIKLEDIPVTQRDTYMNYKPQTSVAPPVMTAEKMWLFIHHPDVPLQMRRSLRNQLRARFLMSAQKKDERLSNLLRTYDQVKKDRQIQLDKVAHMDELLRKWNSGEVK